MDARYQRLTSTPAGRRLRPKANQAAGMSIVQDVQIPIAVQQEIH
jgi:hypothetical protein